MPRSCSPAGAGAGAEACRQVRELARAVSKVAEELGVCWWTVMNAVIEHGTPLVDDPKRVGRVRQLSIDESSFPKAKREHSTIGATGLVDLEGALSWPPRLRRAATGRG